MRLEPKECRPYCAAGASPWRNRQSNDAALTLSPKEEKKESLKANESWFGCMTGARRGYSSPNPIRSQRAKQTWVPQK
jgi:hypothetical protein